MEKNNKTLWGVICLSIILPITLFAQAGFPVNGTADEREGLTAYTNATIHTDYKTTLQNATLLIRKGKIEAVGTDVKLPAGTMVFDATGKHIYPTFIEPFSNFGQLATASGNNGRSERGSENAFISQKKGAYYWNQAIRPETDAAISFVNNPSEAEELRKIGFGYVVSQANDGIARGSAALISLSDKRENLNLVAPKVAAAYSFDKGSSTQDYPNSLMGAIALFRQAFLDADWYAKGGMEKQRDLSLEALNNLKQLPSIFEVNNKQSGLRAAKLGKEFGLNLIIKGSGDEYQMANELKATGYSLIIPLTYPLPYDVADPMDADQVSLAQLKHWEMAPANANLLLKAGISFSITTSGLKSKSDFHKNLVKAIQYGLSKEEALKALTFNPAKSLKIETLAGSIQSGREASFFVTNTDYFTEQGKVLISHIGTSRILTSPATPTTDIRGKYELSVNQNGYNLSITGTPESQTWKIEKDSLKVTPKVIRNAEQFSFQFAPDRKKKKEMLRLYGWLNGKNLVGRGEDATGKQFNWQAKFIATIPDTIKPDSAGPKPEYGSVLYPFSAYGSTSLPKTENLVFRKATVWTNEAEGKLENADVWIADGKIKAVGKAIAAPGATEINAEGKHISSGIIDEHSHIAISYGVNEGSQNNTSEVRIGDVVDNEDINIYRQLSGGVVASQLLHGSANPIGGQSALIKLRWGAAPEAMKIEGADGFIKFALGENVKQSNWGDNRRSRFPQTRMGVEQVFVDAFTRAKVYAQELKNYNGKGIPPRRDLELETILEILNNKRFITCHSYVQSEINMLMKVADSLGFKVNTFTHILEGYKVADKMKKHGVNASTFADWWAYKMEVQDAIPFNAAIMTKAGLNTCINSDDPEMGRRLNQEAAKTVKYGNISEIDALKMATLNPAKALHLDNRMGSIKPGKDADIVLWSGHPLSIYTRPEKTIVDGKIYFDLEKDKALQESVAKESAALIAKILADKSEGSETQGPHRGRRKLYDCDTIEENYSEAK